MPIECLAPYSHHTHLVAVTLAPLGFIAVILLVGASLKPGSTSRLTCQHAAIMVAFIVLPTTSTSIIRTFHCERFGTYGEYLVADFSINCDGAAHRRMMIFASIMVALYPIGVPMLFLVLLTKDRDAINPRGFDFDFSAIAQRNADPSITVLKPLFEPFKPSLWFFEVIDLWRRILMLGTLVLVPGGRPVRAAVGLFLALMFAAVYRELEPYATNSVNILSAAAMWQIVLVFLAGLLITGRPFGYDDFILGVFLLLVSLFFFATAIILQTTHGTAKLELEHRILEHEAREVDLALSHAELLACVDSVAGHDKANQRRLSGQEEEYSAVKFARAVHNSNSWCAKHPKRFFDDGAYPCFVIPHSNLVNFQRLPMHEDALKLGTVVELRAETLVPSSAHTYFVSQNWEGALGSEPNGARHPDNALNVSLGNQQMRRRLG